MTGIEPGYIKAMMGKGHYTLERVGRKTAVMVYTMENGFEITVSSACCNPDDYDDGIARENCLRKVEDKLWELESYVHHVECAMQNLVWNRLCLKKHSAGWIGAYAAICESPTARIRLSSWAPGMMVMAGQGCERGRMIMTDRCGNEHVWVPCDYELESMQWEIWDCGRSANHDAVKGAYE